MCATRRILPGDNLAGSVNIVLQGKFATWAGTVLDRAKPIVLVAEPGCEREAAMRLGRIGFDHLAGYLQGGMEALAARPDLVAKTERMSAATLAEQLSGPKPPTVLDVRTEKERNDRSIAGSLHIPLPHLVERHQELKGREQVVVHCASGYRSSIAASLLERQGYHNVMDLVGGIEAWNAFAATGAKPSA